jgi:hypothetical protein
VSTGTRAVDELTVLLRPAVRATAGKLPEIVMSVALLITALAVFALSGAALDDHTISANKGVAEAEVLDGSNILRTLVRFTVANGEAVAPERGLFYPRGLQPGDRVAVEYDVAKPDLVRLAGRTWIDGLPTLGGVIVATWLLLGPVILWLRRRRSRAAARLDQGQLDQGQCA